ncbi:MAG: putative uridylyltransferase [Chlamydiia bacterium]|nr:putative uridylyltransferase [Chlamydiia bacterium]MCH9616247.1 putative uridylyltransferase [Chlamydiia bacterium]MCH9629767.1 putative uridylyltransferase [Chlamydiia bacterium]
MKKSGAIILAGGQGTRLGLKGPKGCVKVKDQMTLFECLIDKLDCPIGIMTSPLNHEETVSFFDERSRFGKEIHFFQQSLTNGSPNGNGMVFHKFYEAGLWDDWQKRGIESLGILPVDDPLGHFDDLLPQDEELVLRCVKSLNNNEHVGRVIEKDGHVFVEEYIHPRTHSVLGYTGQFGCSMDFVERIAKLNMPSHTVVKRGKERVEHFIIDTFPYANTHRIVVSDRRHFAPVKDQKSLEFVRRILNQ